MSEHFAHDQLWQQLELRNEALLKCIRKREANAAQKEPGKAKRRVTFALDAENDDHDNKSQDAGHGVDSDSDSDDNEDLDDENDDEDEEVDGDGDDSADDDDDRRVGKGKKSAPPLEEDIDEKNLTPFQKAALAARREMEAMESASVESRPWHLRGEVSAFSRPKDSLLEEEHTMQHDLAARPRSVIMDVDMNETLETMIKQRIVDGLFDDITPSLPPEYAKNKRKDDKDDLPEVSQEQSKEGLGELYAREYSEQQQHEQEERARSAAASKSSLVEKQRSGDELLTDAQQTVNRLYSKLADKLDALASLHFTPTSSMGLGDDDNKDMVVKQVKKAVTAEEVIPEGTSDADVLTAHEVFSAQRNATKNEDERTKGERKARRRANKARAKKKSAALHARASSDAFHSGKEADRRRAERMGVVDKKTGIAKGAVDGATIGANRGDHDKAADSLRL